MRILRLVSIGLILIGFLFKMSHWPAGSFILLLGTLMFLIYAIIYGVKNFKTHLVFALINLSCAFWLVYIFYRVQYWAGARPVLLVAFTMFVATAIVVFNAKDFKRKPTLFFWGLSLFSIGLYFTRTYTVHSFVSLNPILYSEGRTENYYEWDKQTWFLYLAKKQDEALKANEKAIEAFKKFGDAGHDYSIGGYPLIPGDATTLQILEQRKQQITDRSWDGFP